MAVATDRGLVVPVIRGAERLSIQEIAAARVDLVDRARGESCSRPISRAAFTISNLGMFGVEQFVAVLNPPQVAILAVGAIEEKPVVRDGEITARPLMSLTLTCDHRAVDGADAADFLRPSARCSKNRGSRSRVQPCGFGTASATSTLRASGTRASSASRRRRRARPLGQARARGDADRSPRKPEDGGVATVDVDDVKAEADRLREDDIEVGTVLELHNEVRLLDVYDPDGNRLQLVQELRR